MTEAQATQLLTKLDRLIELTEGVQQAVLLGGGHEVGTHEIPSGPLDSLVARVGESRRAYGAEMLADLAGAQGG